MCRTTQSIARPNINTKNHVIISIDKSCYVLLSIVVFVNNIILHYKYLQSNYFLVKHRFRRQTYLNGMMLQIYLDRIF